jgi:RNA polymerase sigma-70 factor (ECF subfamily)
LPESIDADHIATLVRQHQSELRLYAAQFSQWADDIVQEAFMELAARSTMPESPRAWLYSAVRSRSLNQKRSQRRRKTRENAVAQSELNRPDNRDGNETNVQWITEAMQFLKPKQREIIALRIWNQLGWKQIAEITQQSTSNAHRQYVDALTSLKLLWEQNCE